MNQQKPLGEIVSSHKIPQVNGKQNKIALEPLQNKFCWQTCCHFQNKIAHKKATFFVFCRVLNKLL